MSKVVNKHIIVCPKCGKQYLPEDIFIPRSFVGDHRITVIEDDPMNLTETYICDKCGAELKITADVSFSVKIENDFDIPKVLSIIREK